MPPQTEEQRRLARGDQLHPVQEAFIEHDAMQCGFCTPGMAMSAAALLERNAHPTEEEVERAISGHICRCGSYPHVVAATLAAAKARKAARAVREHRRAAPPTTFHPDGGFPGWRPPSPRPAMAA